MNCSKKESEKIIELAADNPFNVDLNKPFDFANVTGESIVDFVNYEIEATVNALKTIKEEESPTFDNVVLPFDAISNELYQANTNSFMLYWTSTDSITRAKGLEYSKKLDSLNTVIYSDRDLFNQFQKIASSEEYNSLSDKKKRLVDDTINEFKQSGVNLNDEDLEKFKALKAEVTDLTSQYSINMNTANLELSIDEAGAKGLPDSFKNKFKQEDGSYKIPVQPSTRGPVMGNAELSETRKAYQILYTTRGADKNIDILDQLIEKRHEIPLKREPKVR